MLRVTTESLDQLIEECRRLYLAGRLPEAETAARRVLAAVPGHAPALLLLGVLAANRGNTGAAIEFYRVSIAADPDNAAAHHNLGVALAAAGRRQEAVEAYRKALRIAPDFTEARDNLGVLLQEMGRFDEAIEVYRGTIQRQPEARTALNNLGVILQRLGRTEEAVEAYAKLAANNPHFAPAHCNLGSALNDCGRMDEALAAMRRAIAIDPDFTLAWSALLIALQYHPDYDARAIGAESRRFEEVHVRRLITPFSSHENDSSPDRRLRIGYVSPDLCDHVVGRFMAPLLAAHDRQAIEIYCYSLRAPIEDAIARELRGDAAVWRDAATLSDSALADLIRADKIDLLVDLAMHGQGGRPLLFARKAAPVQLTYLAYCGTTGLSAIDYRLSDPYLDPPGTDESCYAEKTVRLPRTYWCYRPSADAPLPAELPLSRNGYVTFGCLNNYCKASRPALDAWAELLSQVKDSRFILYCPPGAHRRQILERFASRGVSGDRVEFVVRGSYEQYLGHYQRIDIALDPFPYGGGTTTCDALWMGVPVITCRGNKPVARAGCSILTNAGLPQFIADSPEAYVRVARGLAENSEFLGRLRKDLRRRMAASPLMDAPAFAREIETAYRQMWRTWCLRDAPGHVTIE